MGVDGLVICLKDDGVYRWKSMDGKNTTLEPPNCFSRAVLNYRPYNYISHNTIVIYRPEAKRTQ